MGKFKNATIVNKHHQVPFDVYIGRGSKWGNPFTHRDGTKAEFKVGSRDEAIAEYRKWIGEQSDLLADIHELQGKTLCCFCKPAGCHGDVLSEYANTFRVMAWLDEPFKPSGSSEFTIALHKLTALYMEGFHVLFDMEATRTTAEYLKALENWKVNVRYIQWFREKGIAELKRLLQTPYAGSDAQKAKLQFVTGGIQDDLDWSERDFKSTCSTLVSSLTGLSKELKALEKQTERKGENA